jgi:phosphoglycerate dehydrogenase-like enzyme
MSRIIPVTIALPLAADLLERVRSVSSTLDVKQLSRTQRYVYREGRPLWAGYNDPPDTGEESEAEAASTLSGILSGTEVLLSNPIVPEDILGRAPALRWLQLTSAGADRLIESPIVLSGRIQVTTASGLHAVPISEYVMGAILAFAKGLPGAMRAQSDSAWRPYIAREVEGATVCIVGLGAIGSAVARLARALGMRVVASRRSCITRTTGAEASKTNVDELCPASDVDYLAAQADYLVLSMPLTDESRGLIGEPQLRAMKPSAVIVNIARGPVIDQASLVRALREGWIAGAALDVTDPEPLPPDSDLWRAPNVLITPHISGGTPRYMDRAIDIFCENLRRYVDGQTMRNIVDPDRGY